MTEMEEEKQELTEHNESLLGKLQDEEVNDFLGEFIGNDSIVF